MSKHSKRIGDPEQTECISLGEYYIFSSLVDINRRTDELDEGLRTEPLEQALECPLELGMYLESSNVWRAD